MAAPSVIATGGNGSTGANYTVSITVPSGHSNRVLYAYWAYNNNGAAPTCTVSSDLDGAMTEIDNGGLASGSLRCYRVFQLKNPSEGTHILTVTSSDTARQHATIAVCTQDQDQTTPEGTANKFSNAASNLPTCTVSSAAGETVLGFVVTQTQTTTITNNQGSQTTEKNQVATGGTTVNMRVTTGAGAASVTFDWNLSATESTSARAVPLKPASGGGGGGSQGNHQTTSRGVSRGISSGVAR